MSWQEYIDKQLMASGVVRHAVIAGHDGNIWAKDEPFNVSRPNSLTLFFLVVLKAGSYSRRLKIWYEFNSTGIKDLFGNGV